MNHALLAILNPEQIEVEIGRADELEVCRGLRSELDERCSFVARKMNPQWLWHAIDPGTDMVGPMCSDAVRTLSLEAERPRVGKANTQKIESQHIHLRTRIKRGVRRTICFCKTERMPDLVSGLLINRYESGRLL